MSKILYPRPYIGNPMAKIFLDGTCMEWYYFMDMYLLLSLAATHTRAFAQTLTRQGEGEAS